MIPVGTGDFDEFVAAAGSRDTHRIAWPTNGQEFEVELLAEDDGDSPYVTVTEAGCPEEVQNVLSDFGPHLEEPLFDLSEIPKEVGRFKATLQYWSEDRVDWESGMNDPDYGFSITKLERIAE